jgi:hypothetical protein
VNDAARIYRSTRWRSGVAAGAADAANWVRRIRVPMDYAETDPTALAFLAAFRRGLAVLGSSEGNNLYVDLQWTTGDVNRTVN